MGSDVDLSQLALDRPSRIGARRHLYARYVLPVVLLLGFLGLGLWAAGDFFLPPRAVTVVPVRTVRGEVRREGTPLFKSAGWIEPRPTFVRVAALAPGVIERLLVVEDQRVEAGEPVAELIKKDALLTLESATAAHQLRIAEREEAEASLDAAKARWERPLHLMAAWSEADAALAHVETQRHVLPYEIRRATTNLEFATRNYEGKNAATDILSGRVIEQARSEMASAQATLEEIKRRQELLQREFDAFTVRRDTLQKQLDLKVDETRAKREAEFQLQAADVRVRQAEIEIEEAKLRSDRMTVRAPVSGRVLHLVAQPGARLSEGRGRTATHDASTVVTMYQPENLQVRADVRFEDIPKVALGQSVRIESRATSKPLVGHVLFVSSEADIQKNTLQVKVAIEGPPDVFKPDMLVDVTFLAPRVDPGVSTVNEEMRILVPSRLVHQDGSGAFVWVADRSDQLARKLSVEIGEITADGFTEVTRGVDLTSRLIAPPHEELVDKMRIRVVGEAAANGTD